MLSGVKFISRDKLDSGEDNEGGDCMTKRKKARGKRDKHRTSKRSSHQSASSSDDHQRIEKRHQKGKKWYSSDEYSSSEEGSSDRQSGRKNQKRRKSKNNMDAIGHYSKHNSKERGNCHHSKQEYSSPSPSTSEDSDVAAEGETTLLKGTAANINIARKEMGLDWMLGPAETTDKKPALVPVLPEEPPADEQMLKLNPRELNPYLKNNGTGYPVEEKTADRDRLPSSSVVGDGGASWRLEALRRAKEQAAREGRKLDEVVGERWGSVGQLAVSAAYSAAPARAHLHEIKNRKRAKIQENETSLDGENEKNLQQNVSRSYSKSVSVPCPEMRAPKVHDTLSWGRKGKSLSASDDSIIAAAASRPLSTTAAPPSSTYRLRHGHPHMRNIKNLQNQYGAPFFITSTAEGERYMRLREIPVQQPTYLSEAQLSLLKVRPAFDYMAERVGWDRLFFSPYPVDDQLTLEFFTSFHVLDWDAGLFSFRLVSQEFHMNRDKMVNLFGFNEDGYVEYPDDFLENMHEFWQSVTGFTKFDTNGSPSGFLRDLSLLCIHHAASSLIFGKTDAHKVQQQELFALYCVENDVLFDTTGFLLKKFEALQKAKKPTALPWGHIVIALAIACDIFTADILEARNLHPTFWSTQTLRKAGLFKPRHLRKCWLAAKKAGAGYRLGRFIPDQSKGDTSLSPPRQPSPDSPSFHAAAEACPSTGTDVPSAGEPSFFRPSSSFLGGSFTPSQHDAIMELFRQQDQARRAEFEAYQTVVDARFRDMQRQQDAIAREFRKFREQHEDYTPDPEPRDTPPRPTSTLGFAKFGKRIFLRSCHSSSRSPPPDIL